MTACPRIISLIIILLCTGTAFGQESPIDFEGLAEEARKEAGQEIEESTLPKAVEDFQAWNLNHIKRVMMWQYVSGIIIFVVVLSIIALGLYFSYIQFKSSYVQFKTLNTNGDSSEKLESINRGGILKRLKTSQKGGEETSQDTNAVTDDSKTTIKLGSAGIEITSSVVGLLTLVVSLAFLYLYLVNVYPIRVLDTGGTEMGDVLPTGE